MNDAAVVTGLMGCKVLFRLDNDERNVMAIQQRFRGGQADDARSDDRNVIRSGLLGDVKMFAHAGATPESISGFIPEGKKEGQWQYAPVRAGNVGPGEGRRARACY